jgi:hypothetical protein
LLQEVDSPSVLLLPRPPADEGGGDGGRDADIVEADDWGDDELAATPPEKRHKSAGAGVISAAY